MDHDDPIRANVADLSACFDLTLCCEALNKQEELSTFGIVAGCMTTDNPQDGDCCELWADAVSVSVTHAEAPKGVSQEILSKVWIISQDEACRTLEITTQLNKQDADSNLSRNFGTNNIMLQ